MPGTSGEVQVWQYANPAEGPAYFNLKWRPGADESIKKLLGEWRKNTSSAATDMKPPAEELADDKFLGVLQECRDMVRTCSLSHVS